MDRRVKFDFEIDFSNGGGIQGQDFRLDIDGEDISDADLAESIVKDMRLLMVENVRILNKEIITEKHKREPFEEAHRVVERFWAAMNANDFRAAGEGEVASEVAVTDGVTTGRAITFSQVREGKILRQVEYWPDPFEAAAWRSQWVERMG
jgi:hypothetical protein